MKAALIFGSSTGNTEAVAKLIRQKLDEDALDVWDVGLVRREQLTDYDLLVLGSPTLGAGELQPDWFGLYGELGESDLSGTRAVFFGLGNQKNHPDRYQDAMGILHDEFREAGADVGLGYTDTAGHRFRESLALVGSKFCGLAIDEDGQPELTEQRVAAWVAQLRRELCEEPGPGRLLTSWSPAVGGGAK